MELWILNNKRFGFTLSEVLVTLGIIGVVSAMTVPTLMNNYQRQAYVTQLHKVYNEFLQVFERYMADQKVDTLNESDIYNNPGALNTFVRNYFKVVTDCGTSMADCFAPSYTYINNAKVINVTGTCNKVFTMASGAVVCMDVENGNGSQDDEGNQEGSMTQLKCSVAVIEVDVNGPKGPNIYGRDYFVMYVTSSGQLVDKVFEANDETFSTSATDGGSSNGAFGKILHDNWEMNY